MPKKPEPIEYVCTHEPDMEKQVHALKVVLGLVHIPKRDYPKGAA